MRCSRRDTSCVRGPGTARKRCFHHPESQALAYLGADRRGPTPGGEGRACATVVAHVLLHMRCSRRDTSCVRGPGTARKRCFHHPESQALAYLGADRRGPTPGGEGRACAAVVAHVLLRMRCSRRDTSCVRGPGTARKRCFHHPESQALAYLGADRRGPTPGGEGRACAAVVAHVLLHMRCSRGALAASTDPEQRGGAVSTTRTGQARRRGPWLRSTQTPRAHHTPPSTLVDSPSPSGVPLTYHSLLTAHLFPFGCGHAALGSSCSAYGRTVSPIRASMKSWKGL